MSDTASMTDLPARESMDFDVVIVGAGPAVLSAAIRLKQISPVAWQHINFFGRYEFRKSPEAIDFEAIVRELSRVPISSTEAV